MSEWISLKKRKPQKGKVVIMKFNNGLIGLVKYDPIGENDFWLAKYPFEPDTDPGNPDDYNADDMILIEPEDNEETYWKDFS